uniref:Glyoxalase domain-containing protein 4 n=1 Tax=Syphacia muris TaxID=451379 RepID=A0A0N5AJ65_9BILA
MHRLIHYTLKVSDRQASRDFFVDSLGMRVLRHEEYDAGCKVECNGPFKNRWSKTLVGYGSEDAHFVLELVYNYDVDKYDKGNDLVGIFIRSTEVYIRCTEKLLGDITAFEDILYLRVLDPDGHAFYIKKGTPKPEPMFKIGLNTGNLEETVDYWTNVLGMRKLLDMENRCVVGYSEEQCCIEWHQISESLNRSNGYGRVAFSIPTPELKLLEEQINKQGLKILFPLQQLGSGDIKESVLILADPNDHEICFVGESEFLKLSEEDTEADDKMAFAIVKEHEKN